VTVTGRRPPRARLDRILVERGLAPTRAKAQALVLAGRVSSEGVRLEKPGLACPVDLPIVLRAGPRWVSRAGEKLDAAVDAFALRVGGRDALDVGASTGGFTEVLLARGARRVIALDVGRGQLDWGLRRDPRVVALEGVNARNLLPEDLPFRPSVATVDVSFISLRLVLPPVAGCMTADADVIALVKPQFEVGRGEVGRGGIVRDRERHRRVLSEIAAFATGQGWGVLGAVAAAVPGAEGNQEYVLHLRPSGGGLDPGTLAEEVGRAVDARARGGEENRP
jgi:23S rRNA (cytidine1920-2'-O)/16S rRNA (cytidine1409-2'-O)-methyltransferase